MRGGLIVRRKNASTYCMNTYGHSAGLFRERLAPSPKVYTSISITEMTSGHYFNMLLYQAFEKIHELF